MNASGRIEIHRYNTVVVGAGAAGMNCAVHLHDFMAQRGVSDPQKRIAVVTRGIELGASRMSGSDKQTYYKIGTSVNVPDSAADFAESLTAGGCAHEDLAMIEGANSLREFFHLVELGVEFPHDRLGAFCGYKTDHDPRQRATSAGPKTSQIMSRCLQRRAERYGIEMFDRREIVQFLFRGEGDWRRIAGVVCLDAAGTAKGRPYLTVFLCENLVLAAGGPGELYEMSVYPAGQFGLHGLALKAGLIAENLTESQFGLASTKFRWNVSGTYMQAIPRIFSTAADGSDEREFLADYFQDTGKIAIAIFMKGYQWPFDPQRLDRCQSSLIDLLVHFENRKGRRVFMDFRRNPAGNPSMKPFDLNDLESPAQDYLKANAAFQASPIERLAHMNPLAIDLYREHGIDLARQPLEIAICAQHNNGGFAVDAWWQSNIPHVFVIGEMAGTHGVKRPGGAALNAGQVGGLRAAQYIVNAYGCDVPPEDDATVAGQIDAAMSRLDERLAKSAAVAGNTSMTAASVIAEIQRRMSIAGGHLRRLSTCKGELGGAIQLCKRIEADGIACPSAANLAGVLQAEQMAIASVAYLGAIVEYLQASGGSRGSAAVIDEQGEIVHPAVMDNTTNAPLRIKPENIALRSQVQQTWYDPAKPNLLGCRFIPARTCQPEDAAFEQTWRDFRGGAIYRQSPSAE